MKRNTRFLFIILTLLPLNFSLAAGPSKIADHTVVHTLWKGKLPEDAVQQAKSILRIGYGHTSHGSQIVSGMRGLVGFANNGNLGGFAYSKDLFKFTPDGRDGSLHLISGSGYKKEGETLLRHDAGYGTWSGDTRKFLDEHPEYNVIIWSWCGQLSKMKRDRLREHYLEPMSQLEKDYPNVTFVYMTGHLDGSGVEGNLHQRNEEIRKFCRENGKWLFDFADIESHDPDGNGYLDKGGNDQCGYDSGNWGRQWQESHTRDKDWYKCSAAHSQPVNANMKAYAAWWLWCRIAGWPGA